MLYQLSYFRKILPFRVHPFHRTPALMRHASVSATPTGFVVWEVMDSNHRRRTPADLQSAPFGHSGNFPYIALLDRAAIGSIPCFAVPPAHPPRQGRSRLPHRLLRADGGIRTHDQLITNQLLWPTELHRQIPPFWIAKVGIKNLSAK